MFGINLKKAEGGKRKKELRFFMHFGVSNSSQPNYQTSIQNPKSKIQNCMKDLIIVKIIYFMLSIVGLFGFMTSNFIVDFLVPMLWMGMP
jgi:hypothetical protein